MDSSGDDELSLGFDFTSSMGFALFGVQNDSFSNASSLALDELAISIGAYSWILSDIIGESKSDIPFLGFVSDESIDSFSFFHAALITGITRTSEEFYIDRIAIAQVPSIPNLSHLWYRFYLWDWCYFGVVE